MRQVSPTFVLKPITFLLFVPMAIGVFLTGCSLEKKSGFNRSMQNLTAHYNILFDANQILQQKQDDYALSFIDSYNELLNVYTDTSVIKSITPDKDLQSAIEKADKIINLKEQSHYLGNAYLILGKANFLGGDYFDAAEYFSYVIRSFPQEKELVQESLIWKTRTLLYLGQLPQAKLVLDSAVQNINPKKPRKSFSADVYATKLQYDIDAQDYADAEDMAKQAINYSHDKRQHLRWTFILAQLQELNHKNDEAIANYGHIAKSNAVFEMAFNAQLNIIRIQDASNGVKLSRIDRLKSLLKNPNNKEFKDQIYYQVAQLYLIDKDYNNAIKNYKLSVRSSVKNQNQKGLSYLRIADINFDPKADYITAKKYYDSTLTALSPHYPGYLIIQKKTSNLQLLTDRLQIIAREDTLQMLVKLDEKTRQARIDTIVSHEILAQQAAAIAAASTPVSNNGDVYNTPTAGGASTFYFYNSNAVSQGYVDFKRQWGDRKLEDNWRRSSRPGSDQPINASASATTVDPNAAKDQLAKSQNAVEAKMLRQDIVNNLPITPDLLAQSNLRVFNAYFDIANFYRDILEDKPGAIGFYNLLLKRFPNNPNQAAIYYSLYRLYTELNDPRADEYKNNLLKNYAETPFAKVILDPDYSRKLGDKDAQFNTIYSQVYDLFAQRKYPRVISKVDSVLQQFPNNSYGAQLSYLRTIAAGHQESVAAFQADLQQMLVKYPNDRLITPLVNQHINYITANLVDMSSRHYALLDTDPSEIPFTPPIENQEKTPYRKPGYHPYFATVPDVRAPPKKADQPKTDSAKTVAAPVLAAKPVHNPALNTSMFSQRDSTEYYFVINISNDNTNLASSRFGIGQFNRVNLQGSDIKHRLTDVGNDNRLIYVGRFYSLASVKDYARSIIPLMPEIMKIPKDKYSFFIITRENLNKLADKKTLDSYIDYYQNNY